MILESKALMMEQQILSVTPQNLCPHFMLSMMLEILLAVQNDFRSFSATGPLFRLGKATQTCPGEGILQGQPQVSKGCCIGLWA